MHQRLPVLIFAGVMAAIPFIPPVAEAFRAVPLSAMEWLLVAIVASANAGLDLRYRVTSNLTLNATINPDFCQVEVDPAVLNLSAFETFFEERRPFFVEGSGLFGFGGLNAALALSAIR